MNDQVSEQASRQAEHSNLNGLDDINEQASGQVSGQASGQYKKEILKRNIKNNNISKDIYVLKFNTIYKNSSFSIIT